jgi:hypothetical protein
MKKPDRFKKRRALLARRHLCTRCGTGRPENGRKWCVGCLAVDSDKRDIRTDAEAKRLRKLTHRRDCLRVALERLTVHVDRVA